MFSAIILAAAVSCPRDEIVIERRVVRSYVVEEAPVVRYRVRSYRVRSVYRDVDDDAIVQAAIDSGARKVEIKRSRRKVKVEIKR
jgi:hypothetical protein